MFKFFAVPIPTEDNVGTDRFLVNPHTCILDDSVECLACALIEWWGEPDRDQALGMASAMAGQLELEGTT